MKGYLAFTKKEFMELIRSYKIMILFIIFMLLGFMNPLIAKFTPNLIKEFMPEGMNIALPEVTVLDSWTQFFKNLPQFGLIILVIVFSGIMSNELTKGTLIHMLTKGMNRKTVIASKFTTAAITWTICYYTAFFITYFYNFLFWEKSNVANLLIAVSAVWLFGLLLISFMILGGVLTKSNYGGMLFTGAIVVCMLIFNVLETIAKFNPLQLITANMPLLTEAIRISELYTSAGVTGIFIVTAILLSLIIFDRKKI